MLFINKYTSQPICYSILTLGLVCVYVLLKHIASSSGYVVPSYRIIMNNELVSMRKEAVMFYIWVAIPLRLLSNRYPALFFWE
jgi:hypothetical protein